RPPTSSPAPWRPPARVPLLATVLAKEPLPDLERGSELGALGGTRTPNLLIRSQMLYPLSYERTTQQYTAVRAPTVRASGAGERTPRPDLLTASAARCPGKPSSWGGEKTGFRCARRSRSGAGGQFCHVDHEMTTCGRSLEAGRSPSLSVPRP